MPGSAISSGTGSHLSSGSRRAKTRRYYKTAHTSQVDESLFGTPHSETKRTEMLQDKWATDNGQSGIERQAAQRSADRKNRQKKGKGGKETVQVITKDLIRNLVVPEEDPSGRTLVISRSDLHRLLEASRVLTEEEKRMRMEEIKRAKEEAMEEIMDRKNYMKMKDLTRQKNEKLSELEEEEREKREHLKQKANEQRQEQEDEIKHLNELILNAKCHAIRDAQILEKDIIKHEMEDEEKRLDIMMEVDRINAIKIQEDIEGQKKDERLIGATKVMEQIQENEQRRLLELEKKDRENQLMQKYLNKLCEEESEKLEMKKQEQEVLRHELNQCNNEILRRKELSKEQEKMEEQKVLEYQQEKAEREAAFEKEQESIRIEKEKEVARLRAQQERARDEQAERDALRAKRAQEQAEREWRKKEAEENRKKAETESMLKKARAQQMDQKEHFLAVQAQRERAEFERVLRAQKELVEKEQHEEEEHAVRRAYYADDVRKQIREKEQVRIADRNAFFEEGVKLDEEARMRRQKLDEVKRKKLDELRNVGIHEKYLSQVERKINHQPQHIAA